MAPLDSLVVLMLLGCVWRVIILFSRPRSIHNTIYTRAHKLSYKHTHSHSQIKRWWSLRVGVADGLYRVVIVRSYVLPPFRLITITQRRNASDSGYHSTTFVTEGFHTVLVCFDAPRDDHKRFARVHTIHVVVLLENVEILSFSLMVVRFRHASAIKVCVLVHSA